MEPGGSKLGIGKLSGGPYGILLKSDAQLVQHSTRPVPEKKKPVYKEELGIIEPAEGHTDWVNLNWSIKKPVLLESNR